MVINKKKTNAMLFTRSKKSDFPPEMHFQDGSPVNIVSQTTLLGVIITDNLKWTENTKFLCLKARRKLWTLKRMLLLDLNNFELFDVYKKEIRSILEYAAPVWHSSLTRKQKSEIESIQKIAFRMILRSSYSTYSRACAYFGTDTLYERRQEICRKFAFKNIESENSMFDVIGHDTRLRKRSIRVKEYKCYNSQYQKSSLPFLAKMVNQTGRKGTLP